MFSGREQSHVSEILYASTLLLNTIQHGCVNYANVSVIVPHECPVLPD